MTDNAFVPARVLQNLAIKRHQKFLEDIKNMLLDAARAGEFELSVGELPRHGLDVLKIAYVNTGVEIRVDRMVSHVDRESTYLVSMLWSECEL